MTARRDNTPQQGSLFDDGVADIAPSDAAPAFVPGATRTVAQTRLAAPSFVAFDVETANRAWGSICSLGYAVVRDGIVVHTDSLLCTPPPGLEQFDPAHIAIHGISPNDVAREPAFGDRFEEFRAIAGDLPVVCHNAKFDMTALRDACQASRIRVPDIEFGCTLVWARIDIPGLPNYKLPTISQHVGVTLDNHHDAAADAFAAAGIATQLARARNSRTLLDYAKATDTVLGSLSPHGLALCASTKPTMTWQGHQPSRKASDMPQPNSEADAGHPLFGQTVVVTGEFSHFTREELWDVVARFGGKPELNVTRRTTVLVKGTWVDNSGTPIETSKERKVREHIAAGRHITILDEPQLRAMIS
ncbi:hypothetical protein IEU95_02465 [Hoyosella rhizosphaerae]|uniref:DNA polymerase III subunit epsilon n=1 Tax=Hoyosella rhizosphaerae TaxID=1755582 RepID=A0A916XF50_9ACTN|nr:exonuclease domain-containing protein [Hoyosella rhizosphaerae]MBN4925679.1 hypothetical protein [Hoyosella rhizosphaerae]GGC68753.1 DNA polymerase III subunit epsilon [Hoyosella rhizosphaerae]